jgi:peptidoglycan biosynthesis protein MviN/MurJ (putative lipid II flippase)
LFLALGHPRRNTIITLIQALTLVLAATPLTLQAGAVGTAIGVGFAFIVGLGVTYYFLRRTLPALDLRGAFLVPALAALATIALWFIAAPWLRADSFSLGGSLALQILFVLSLYTLLSYALRPRMTRERAVYVWSLLRQRPAQT